jgi:hypothetical protein
MNLQEFDKFIEKRKFFTEDFEKELRKRFESEAIFKNGNYFAILTKDFSILIETFENKFDESLMIKEIKRYVRQENKNVFPFTDENKKNTSIWNPNENE